MPYLACPVVLPGWRMCLLVLLVRDIPPSFFPRRHARQSIFGVIQHLRLRRQSAKLKLYLQFRLVLGASFLFGVAWSIFGIIRLSEEETVSDGWCLVPL